MLETMIVVDGSDVDVESLWDWLREEPQLRGRVSLGKTTAQQEAMGTSTDILVVAASTASVLGVLARTLSVWLVQRRSDVTVTVTGPDGREVAVSARRVADPEQLLRSVLELPADHGEATQAQRSRIEKL